MNDTREKIPSPWLWVPTLYFAQGLPNGLHEDILPALLKGFGVGNTDITHLIALVALPWSLKPLWSPVTDTFGTKRGWILAGQAALALAALAFVFFPSFGMPRAPVFVALFAIAFFSSTHDIAADGFYLFGVRSEHEQAAFSGIRNTAYRLAKVFAASAVVGVAGLLARGGASTERAWTIALGVFAAAACGVALWNAYALPKLAEDKPVVRPGESPMRSFADGFVSFFQKPGVGLLILFIVLYRLPEVLIGTAAPLFLKDPAAKGGLALDDAELAWVSGAGVVALLAGGIAGGALVSRFGLKKMLWPFALLMHLPNFVFLALAHWRPESLALISGGMVLEKLGYGFGLSVLMLYMIHSCRGERRVTHYAIASGLTIFGAKAGSYFVGDIQDSFGHPTFFICAIVCALPSLVVLSRIRDIPEEFGKRA